MIKFSVILSLVIQSLEALEKAALATETGSTFNVCFYAIGAVVLLLVAYEVSQAEFRK